MSQLSFPPFYTLRNAVLNTKLSLMKSRSQSINAPPISSERGEVRVRHPVNLSASQIFCRVTNLNGPPDPTEGGRDPDSEGTRARERGGHNLIHAEVKVPRCSRHGGLTTTRLEVVRQERREGTKNLTQRHSYFSLDIETILLISLIRPVLRKPGA